MPVLGSTTAASGAGALPGNPNFQGMQPVGDHCDIDIGATAPTAGGTFMIRHNISFTTRTISFVYCNKGGGGAVTIKAGFSLPNSGGGGALTFNGGQTSVVLPVDGIVQTDPIMCSAQAGSYITSLTYATIAAGSLPATAYIYRTFASDGFAAGVDHTSDGSVAGFDYSTTQYAFGPSMILGTTGKNLPIVGSIGDSIMNGSGDPTLFGHFERAGSGHFMFVRTAKGGEASTALSYLGVINRHRLTFLSGCTHILDHYGANDLTGSITTAQLATNLLLGWRLLAGTGAKIYQGTLLPKTSSTDSFATTANQTVTAYESVRIGINDWVRGGAHVDGSGVPVFDGTGTPSSYLTGYVELADAVETSRNSGRWKSPGWTADGVHPSTTGHTAMAVVDTAWQAALNVP